MSLPKAALPALVAALLSVTPARAGYDLDFASYTLRVRALDGAPVEGAMLRSHVIEENWHPRLVLTIWGPAFFGWKRGKPIRDMKVLTSGDGEAVVESWRAFSKSPFKAFHWETDKTLMDFGYQGIPRIFAYVSPHSGQTRTATCMGHSNVPYGNAAVQCETDTWYSMDPSIPALEECTIRLDSDGIERVLQEEIERCRERIIAFERSRKCHFGAEWIYPDMDYGQDWAKKNRKLCERK